MAGPISVAGSAVGIISVSIQVTQFLLDFYNAFEYQLADTVHTVQKLGDMLEILNTLQKRLGGLRVLASEQDVVSKIYSLISESEECIREFQNQVERFKQCPLSSFQSAVRTTAPRVTNPFRRSTLEKLDEDIDDVVDRLKLALQFLQQDNTDLSQGNIEGITVLIKRLSKSFQDSTKAQDWLKSLNAPDVTINFNEACRKKQPQTGLWFVQGETFGNWLTTGGSLLWLKGSAGCGKSVLFSTAIEHAYQHRRSNPKVGVAFFFFSFSDQSKQDTSALIRALVLQLSAQAAQSGAKDELEKLPEINGQKAPSDTELPDFLKRLISIFPDVYILIDALDENPQGTHREAVLQFLSDIRTWQKRRLHLLVTSRDDIDIHIELDPNPSEIVEMRNKEVDEDISASIIQTLRNNQKLAKWRNYHGIIQTALTQRANGMQVNQNYSTLQFMLICCRFRWVECQFQSLACCPPDKQSLQQLLQSLPTSLDKTYARVLDRVLENIAPDLVDYVQQMLNILCCATRPLSGGELLDALAVKFDPNSSSDCLYRYDTRRRCADISVFEEICPGFIELDTDHDTREVTVRIAHFSIQEFLESERILCYNNIEIFHVTRHRGHTQMAGICLASLLHPQQKNCPTLSDGIGENAFLQYAACYWHEHFAQCSSKASIGRQALSLFQAKSPQFQRWIRVFGDDGDKCRSACKNSVPLYYAAKLGLVIIARLLLASHKVRYGSAPAPGNDQKMDDSSTVALRNPDVSKSLPKDLYINFEAGFYGTALQVASYEGHTSIVKLLLDRGADSNVQNKYRETPLKVASIRGYESIVKLLLDNGADVNTNVDGIFNTALQAASFSGRERVVQLLLAGGADVNAEGGVYKTALHAASYYGHENIVRLLLDNGADINAKVNGAYSTALQAATSRGSESVVRLLLERGADVRLEGKVYKSTLSLALEQGHQGIAQLLRVKGANGAGVRKHTGS